MPKLDADPKLIRALAEAMRDTGLTEVEYKDGNKSLRLSSIQPVAPAPTMIAAPPAVAHATVTAAPAAGAAAPTIDATAATVEDAKPAADAVTSPMVGTVYLSPSPDAPAFVQVGETVSEGQTLMIIEAMKVMNPIAAPRGGVVSEVLVRDKQPVEFGENLIRLA